MTNTEGQVYSETVERDGRPVFIIRVTRTVQTYLVTVEHAATGAQVDRMRWATADRRDAWTAVLNRRGALTLELAT